ncbi:MAG: methyltransferase domain-containing protein [Aquificae bacterium]|nr:methyltransferase domain-containing protein [Aquificota bacterium]
MTKRYIYTLTEEQLGELLATQSVPLEIIKRQGNLVEFATYQPLENLKPIREEEVGEDWKNWKQSFGPVDVEDFVIMPPWKKPVFINPGMAFGTGLHPTTRLCIKALKEELREGDSLLDVGTGSGVLAIISKMLGAGRVLGIDVSKDALRACLENSKLNGVDIEFRLATPSEVEESFDVVVANLELNIFEEELTHILPLYRSVAIFSGIYKENELKKFLEMLHGENLKEDRIISEENWHCIVVKDEGN